MDRRQYARVPFGYDIVNGSAVINEVNAAQLKLFFNVFMEGESMAEAARQAGLQCSTATYPHLFKRKEYCGTDYYPAIINTEYQQILIAEWERRKGQSPLRPKKRPRKGVQLYTEFKLTTQHAIRSDDPVEAASAFYLRIRPCYQRIKNQAGH